MARYYVAGYTKDEVTAGVHVYISHTISQAVFNENKEIFDLSLPVEELREVAVIIYASKGSNSPPSRLIDKLGKYYSYIFLNEGSRNLAQKHGIGLRLLGEVEEEEKPPDAFLLVRSAYISKKDG